MARRTAQPPARESGNEAQAAALPAADDDGVLSFAGSEFTDDTVIRATEEVFVLLNSVGMGAEPGFDAGFGWNLFVFG